MSRRNVTAVEKMGAEILRCTECPDKGIGSIYQHRVNGIYPRGFWIESVDKDFKDVDVMIVGQNPAQASGDLDREVKAYKAVLSKVKKITGYHYCKLRKGVVENIAFKGNIFNFLAIY
jgi:hypothetical protein